MKNLKSIALGLVVGAMAIGFSSFTNAKKLFDSNVYVQLANGTYQRVLASEYDNSNCSHTTEVQCAFDQTGTSGGPYADNIPASTINSNPDFTADGTDKGTYTL